MTQQPFTAAALRGAVDLSALKRPATPSPGPGMSAGSSPGSGGGTVLVEAGDATFQDVVTTSLRLPVIVVLWSARLAQSRDQVASMVAASHRSGGRFQVASVDIDANPGLQQAFGVDRVPMTVAVIQGQPVPLFIGAMPDADVDAVVEQVAAMAVQNGLTGRVDLGADGEPADTDEPADLPAHLQAAYDAIEADDLDTAVAIYETALGANPGDDEARIGLAQVRLLQRTRDLDPGAVRSAAAAQPDDVGAQIRCADLDMVGGHVADAFARLVDAVRRTDGDARTAARDHLLGLFEIVGAADQRVSVARRQLMSALF